MGAWAGTSNAEPAASVFNGGEPRSDRNQVWLVGGRMGLFPGPGGSMRIRPGGWTKAPLMSTLMLKWKIRGRRHIWKTSLCRPMRENGGCVTSHLLWCIKGDVWSHFPDFPPARAARSSGWLAAAHPLNPNSLSPHVTVYAHESHLAFR